MSFEEHVDLASALAAVFCRQLLFMLYHYLRLLLLHHGDYALDEMLRLVRGALLAPVFFTLCHILGPIRWAQPLARVQRLRCCTRAPDKLRRPSTLSLFCP